MGSNWTLRGTLEFAVKEGMRANVRCFGLSVE
jgi:hypothetical protein